MPDDSHPALLLKVVLYLNALGNIMNVFLMVCDGNPNFYKS